MCTDLDLGGFGTPSFLLDDDLASLLVFFLRDHFAELAVGSGIHCSSREGGNQSSGSSDNLDRSPHIGAWVASDVSLPAVGDVGLQSVRESGEHCCTTSQQNALVQSQSQSSITTSNGLEDQVAETVGGEVDQLGVEEDFSGLESFSAELNERFFTLTKEPSGSL